MSEDILDEEQFENSNLRRRDLLPIWIKVFLWIFLFTGAIVPFVVFIGITGQASSLALYGIETSYPFSLPGIIITLLFTVKGIVSFGLWTEKDWAVRLAMIDALVGIIICVFMMAVIPFLGNSVGVSLNIRIELIALIPYLNKMTKIKDEWARRIKL